MQSVLIVSPVKQIPAILEKFLEGLEHLDTEGLNIAFHFIDDNDDPASVAFLEYFCRKRDAYCTRAGGGIPYLCDEETHHWEYELWQRVANFKDFFIQIALAGGYDYIFLIDSDLVLHPQTLKHLLSLNKDIVSEVFWTRCMPDRMETPNVWLAGEYGGVSTEFINMLRKPGTYQVGGLGACTLISRKALIAGVSFAKVDNLDYAGEDRAFCIRARVLGLELWADTHYQPYHIYRESELSGLPIWKDRLRERGSRITVGMLVHNEAGRYLRRVLEQAKQFADNIVILDDASTDDTVQVCCEALGVQYSPNAVASGSYDPITGKKVDIWRNQKPGFDNEIGLRKQLWSLCMSTKPDWIMIMDADEVWENRCIEELPRLAANPTAEAYAFRLFDMWDADHYREDAYWCAHYQHRVWMVRYIPGFDYTWNDQPLHCGRLPNNLQQFRTVNSDLRIKHLGWAKPEDRQRKYDWYMTRERIKLEGEGGEENVSR